MAIETFQDPSTGLIIQRVVGDLHARDVLAAQRRLYVEERIDPRTPVLWDARGSGAPKNAQAEIAELAAHGRDFWSAMAGGKTAIVTAAEVTAGATQIYHALGARMPRELELFTEYREAVGWLTGETVTPPAESR